MAPHRFAVAATLVGLAACGDPGAATTGFTTPGASTRPVDTSSGETSSSTGGGTSTTSTSSSSSNGSSTTDGGSSSTTADMTVLDMGTQPDFGGPAGCKGKIDFLFVLSRSSLMWESQEQLVAAFPQFIAAIQSQFTDFDVHIMVVDSEKEWKVENCDEQCPKPCDVSPDYPCGVFPPVCDLTMGAGTVYNAGPYTLNAPCGLDTPRYITADTPNPTEVFECIARVGTYGYNLMGDALVAAVSPKLNGPGGCNEGFLRDEALLVLTMIGPEDSTIDNNKSSGTWQQWRQAVVDAKKGDENAVVALGIIAGDDCLPMASPHIRLCELIPSFPNSILEHLSLKDFGPVFEEAAELALDACTLFVPG